MQPLFAFVAFEIIYITIYVFEVFSHPTFNIFIIAHLVRFVKRFFENISNYFQFTYGRGYCFCPSRVGFLLLASTPLSFPLDIIYYTLFIGKSQVVIFNKYSAKKLCNLHKYKNRVAYNRRRRGEYKYKKERAEKSAH